MSAFDIFKTMPERDERQDSIVRRIRQNVAHEVDALPPVHGHRDKKQIAELISRLRALNRFL